MDVDEVFEKIGEFGPGQMKIIFPTTILLHCFLAFQTLIIAFIGQDPDWSCTESQKDSTKEPQLLFGSIDPRACVLFESGNCTPDFENDFTSIVTEWNLICDRSNLPNLSQSIFFVGSLFGAWIWGSISDKIGRRKVFFLTSALLILSGISTALSFGYYSFVFFRLCSAISGAGAILSSYVLCLELVGKSGRNLAGIAGSVIFALAFPVLSVMAYYIRNWRLLTLVTSASYVVVFALNRILPESPRWLLVNGNVKEARTVLESIAKGNGTVMPAGNLKVSDSSAGSMKDLCTGHIMRNRTLKLVGIWFTASLVYYGLTMSSGELGSSIYVSFSLSGLIELPSIFLSYKMLNSVGRRWTHGGFLLISGVAGILHSLFYWAGIGYLGSVIAFLGKFGVAASFAVVYLYTAELYPTQIRNVGLGVCSVGARLGGILAPIVLMSSQYDRGLPMMIMGCLGLVAGLVGLSLPETLNQPMLDTLSDIENQHG